MATRSDVRRRRHRRRLRVVGAITLVVVLAGLGTGAVLLLRDDGNGGSASVETVTAALQSPVLQDQGDVLAIDAAPASYRVVYRIDSSGTEGVTSRTQVVEVQRPFDAHVVVYRGTDATGDPEVDVRSNVGLYADTTDPSNPEVGSGIPAAALGDLRLDGAIGDLVDAGLFVRRERREVAGRECQVYRTGQALESLQLSAPTDTNYADVCVDAAGLLLEQVAYTDGKPELYEVAVSVEAEPTFASDSFTIAGTPRSLSDGGVQLSPIDPSVAPTSGYWTPVDGMPGATHVGRYLLQRPNTDTSSTTTTAGTATTSPTIDTYVDVYSTGSSFVIVQQGPAASAPSRDTTLGADADAGALGTARVAFGLSGNTLVATTASGFVEITAPMSANDLAAVARTFTVA
jgi:hypothetical protein